MTDAAVTPDIVIPHLDAPAREPDIPAAPPVVPQVDDEQPPDRRRRLLLLFLLLGLLLLLMAFGIWYFLFRQPIESFIPGLDLAKPPAYQLSIYGVTKPLGIAVSSDGSRIYVTQGGGPVNETVVLDGNGSKLGVLAPPTAVVEQATQLYVAVNPMTGDVYATDRTAGAVFRYAADGTYQDTFSPGASISSWQPLAIAFDASGNLYVSDVGGNFQKVHVFGPDGTWLRDLGSDGEFAFPNGIGIDANGNVYVSDSNNGRLIVFDKSGNELGSIHRGTADGELGLPRGVVVDGKGRVYVVDAVGQSVELFRALQQGETAPAYQARFGHEGTIEGAFEFPNGIAVDGRGRVYVTDWNNDRLQLWSY